MDIDFDKNKRFWDKVHIKEKEKCWEWLAYCSYDGYGKFRLPNKTYRASRYAYELIHGELPKDIYVLHKCDNPVCCNPNHLYAGTAKDNSQDMVNKGRSKAKEKHHMFGKQTSVEVKEKISKSLKGEKNGMFGKKHSQETREKMSINRRLARDRRLT